jgi:hypothetical protein
MIWVFAWNLLVTIFDAALVIRYTRSLSPSTLRPSDEWIESVPIGQTQPSPMLSGLTARRQDR